jgi:hypothetical protein
MSASWRAAFKTAVIAVETIIGAALLVGIFYSAFFSHAQQPDPLGSVGPTVFPFPAPSIDTTARTFVMNGERYDIPGNFLPSGDKQIDGSSRAISVRALLPEIVGITRETSECLSALSTCRDRAVTIGLLNGPPAVSGSQVLQNIKPIVFAEKFAGPCGLEFYEDKSNESQRHRYFFKR